MVFTTASAPSDTCWMLPKTVRMRSWVPGGCLFWGVSLIFALESASILFSSARTSPQESSGMRIWAVMLSLPTGVADLPVAVLRCSWSSNTSERMAAMALAILFLGPVIPTTRASVQGEKSVAFETLTRAPDFFWINWIVAPALPMIVPMSLLGISSLKNFGFLSKACFSFFSCAGFFLSLSPAAGVVFCAFSGEGPSPSTSPSMSVDFLFFRFFLSPPSVMMASLVAFCSSVSSMLFSSMYRQQVALTWFLLPQNSHSSRLSAAFLSAMSPSRGCSTAACARHSEALHLKSMPLARHLRHGSSAPFG
mmetsp:Transcript_9966/g.24358  ORF Transcript_9966/g.24358 Transcript_9966/m.24358 type:complete len:308 (+) Transcript_9966:664-1587(+)